MIKDLVKKYPLLIFIILLAFVIRLIAGHVQSLSNDELSAIYRLQFGRFSDLIHWGIKVDGHPALVQLFLYYYTPLVGKSEILIRLPFIIASSLSLAFIFFSLKKLAGEFTGYMVVIILALSGFSIQLGYFARPYAFGILFTSAAAYYWIRIFIENERTKKYILFFIISSILGAYTHYFALLEITVLGLAAFIFSPIKNWWKMLLAGAIVLIAFLPHYPITAFQMSVGGIGGWLGKPKDYFIVNLLLEYFNRSAWLIGIVVLIPMLMIIRNASIPKIKLSLLMLFLSVVPFCILYFYSIKINSVLQFSACFFLMPFLLGAFFSLFENMETSRNELIFKRTAAGIVLFVFLVNTIYANHTFSPVHFAEFKRIAEYIEEHESESVTTVVAVNNPFYIDYYLKDKKPDLYITDMGDDLDFLRRYIDTCKTERFIYAFVNQRSNGEIPFMIQHRYKSVSDEKSYLNSELYHLYGPSMMSITKDPFEPAYSFYYQPSSGNFMDHQSWPGEIFGLEPEKEFSATLEIDLNTLDLQSYDKVLLAAITQENVLCDFELVLSIEQEGKTVFWRSRRYQHQSKIFADTMATDTLVDTTKQKRISPLYTRVIYRPTHFAGLVETFNDENIDLKNGKLKAYIWNPNHCNCVIEEFSVRFYKGNPFTTGYSQ